MPWTRAALFSLAPLLATPQAHAAKTLTVQFQVSNTEGFDGSDPATLTLSKGNLSGSVSVVSPGGGPYPCAVNFGSTLIGDQLAMTCTIGPDEIVTFSGRLNPRTGAGRGIFAETFFKEQGTYKASPAD